MNNTPHANYIWNQSDFSAPWLSDINDIYQKVKQEARLRWWNSEKSYSTLLSLQQNLYKHYNWIQNPDWDSTEKCPRMIHYLQKKKSHYVARGSSWYLKANESDPTSKYVWNRTETYSPGGNFKHRELYQVKGSGEPKTDTSIWNFNSWTRDIETLNGSALHVWSTGIDPWYQKTNQTDRQPTKPKT